MAISGSSVWECRSNATAANAGGGFFVPGATGTDYSKQAAPQYSLSGGSSAGAGAVLLHANAADDMVGNGLHIISGTNATVGWYEIISVSAGVSITTDRNCTSGVGATIVFNVGGALSLGSSTAGQTDGTASAAMIAGNTVWMMGSSGPMTIAATWLPSTGAINFIGYFSTRGDNPTGSTRPTLNMGASTFTWAANNIVKYIMHTATTVAGATVSTNAKASYCKFTNTSTSTGRAAVTLSTGSLNACEAQSYRGNAVNMTAGANNEVLSSYIHDSVTGINATTGLTAYNCVIESNCSAAIAVAGNGNRILGCTLYGGQNKTGQGINIASGAYTNVFNNLIYGFTTGICDLNTLGSNYGDNNALNNNTTNYTIFADGTGAVTTSSYFKSVAQITGATATTSSNVLTQAGGTFSGIVNNQDFCYITAGSGITVAAQSQYLITANTATTLTLDVAPGPGATGDRVYQVTTGRNFGIGSSYVGMAAPRTFPAGIMVTGASIGAVQRLENYPAASDVRLATSFSNAELTGTVRVPVAGKVQSGFNYDSSDSVTGTLATTGGVPAGPVALNTTSNGGAVSLR